MEAERSEASPYLSKLADLEAIRLPWEDEWQDVADFIPGFGELKVTGRGSGDKRGPKKSYDGTATALLNLMADGLFGKLIPPSVPWFRLRSSNNALDQFKPFREWIERCDEVVYKSIERSNFYDTAASAFYIGGGIGTVVILMEEDVVERNVVFSLRNIKECYLARNRNGQHDTLYRKYEVEARNLAEQFGDELDAEFLELAEKRPYELHEVLHVIEPDGRKSWKSLYIILETGRARGGGKIIHRGRYTRFPVIVWTFRDDPTDAYGRCPTMDALYDIEMLNFQAKLNAEAGHLATKPPLVAHQSMNGRIRFSPGAVTYYDSMIPGMQMPQPLITGAAGYQIGVDQQERRSRILRQHYRSDIFSYLVADLANGTQRERTATEISAIEAQSSTLLSPITGRIQKMICEKVVSFTFQVEAQAGRLPPMPEELAKAMAENPRLAYDPMDIEYTGPLAQGQKRFLKSQDIMRGVQSIFNIAQGAPQVIDGYDWDAISAEASESEGLPSSMSLDPRIVKRVRERRAAQQQAMMQLQAQGEQAKAYSATTKAPEPGSPAGGGA